MPRLSDRIVAPLMALSLVLIVVVVVGWGRAAAVSQENATLEQRVSMLETHLEEVRAMTTGAAGPGSLTTRVDALERDAFPPPNPALSGVSDDVAELSLFDQDYTFGIVCRDGDSKTGATVHACTRVP